MLILCIGSKMKILSLLLILTHGKRPKEILEELVLKVDALEHRVAKLEESLVSAKKEAKRSLTDFEQKLNNFRVAGQRRQFYPHSDAKNDSDLFEFDEMIFTTCGKTGAYGPR